MRDPLSSLREVKKRAIGALYKELGLDGLIRFFQEYELDYGDYIADREKWLKEKSLDESFENIKAWKEKTR